MSLTNCVCDVPTQVRSQAQIALFALMVSPSALGCFAQSAPASCNEVHAYASVLNSKGQMANGLDASNFQAELRPALKRKNPHKTHRCLPLGTLNAPSLDWKSRP